MTVPNDTSTPQTPNPKPQTPFVCPIPKQQYENIVLAHGAGGRLMHNLIDQVFAKGFGNPLLETDHDSAVLEHNGVRLCFTTDSYVVNPIFFPGGDIGTLAVCGTVNDLAMSGARPLYLSAGFILEEGLPITTLQRIVQSMQATAKEVGVAVVTGDTKVVERGKADGLFINTAGIGICEKDLKIAPRQVREGDVLLLNGDIGRHGMAIMALREGLRFETTIRSDVAPLWGMVEALLDAGIEIHCLRDLTRGGLASALNEIAKTAGVRIAIDERSIPVRDDVNGACEMLGLDPLQVANEGRLVAFVKSEDADRALEIMRGHPLGEQAARIGQVTAGASPLVTMNTVFGAARIVDMLSGDPLPRIC